MPKWYNLTLKELASGVPMNSQRCR